MDRNGKRVQKLTKKEVALRKESVDRNLAVWAVEHAYQVALRKESVDRNIKMQYRLHAITGRSPQGERG